MDKKVIGIAILIIVIILLVLGFQEFGAFGSSLSRAVGRGQSTRAVIMLVAGAACAGFGALRIFIK